MRDAQTRSKMTKPIYTNCLPTRRHAHVIAVQLRALLNKLRNEEVVSGLRPVMQIGGSLSSELNRPF